MSQDHVTAGAVTHTIGTDHGVVATVVTDAGDVSTRIASYRASGDALEVLGVLHALRQATHRRTAGTVTIHARDEVVAAIEAHLAHGTIVMPEALHQMVAVARIHHKAVHAGVNVIYRAPATVLPAEDHARFTDLVNAETTRHSTRHAAGWQLPQADADWVAEHDARVVYTDGSQMASTGFGAWAWWVDDTTHGCGAVAGVSSTHTERLAILRALRALRPQGAVLVVTDLDVVLPYGAGRAVHGGHARVIRQLRHELARPEVRVLNVKGHDVCPGNLAVDELAGRTLRSTWAQLSARPDLAQRLIALHEQRAATTRQLRIEAGLRGERRHEAWLAQQANAGIVPTRAQRSKGYGRRAPAS